MLTTQGIPPVDSLQNIALCMYLLWIFYREAQATRLKNRLERAEMDIVVLKLGQEDLKNPPLRPERKGTVYPC